MMKYYVLMSNSSKTMELYQAISKENVDCTIVPTPRNVDHCCGVSILYNNENDKDTIQKIANLKKIDIDDFFECENTDNPNRFKFC